MQLSLLKSKIAEVPDWPKPGVLFREITPALSDSESFHFLIDELAKLIQGEKIDKIVGIDARGFLLASALAYKLNLGLLIARKKGKLPGPTVEQSYTVEYGSRILEMTKNSITPGERILIVDDVLASGGTTWATAKIVRKLGGEITCILFFIEIARLKGRTKLKGENVKALVKV